MMITSDMEVAGGLLAAVMLVFVIALVAQRLNTPRHPLMPTLPPVAETAGHGKTRLDLLSDQMGAQDERLKKVEHDVNNIRTGIASLPSKDLVHRLEVQLAEVQGKLSTVDVTSLANQRMLERIENFLIQKGA